MAIIIFLSIIFGVGNAGFNLGMIYQQSIERHKDEILVEKKIRRSEVGFIEACSKKNSLLHGHASVGNCDYY